MLNVRLGPEEARMAAELRKSGVAISSLVRGALRAEHERRIRSRPKQKGSELIASILESLPDTHDVGPRRTFELTDRAAVREHIRAKLARRDR